MKSLRKSYIAKHREIWNWLADNPSKEKKDWPGWEEYVGSKIEINYCFLCDYVNFAKGGMCSFCPLDWGITKKCMQIKPELSYYLLYSDAPDLVLKSKYAEIIANLPEKDYTE